MGGGDWVGGPNNGNNENDYPYGTGQSAVLNNTASTSSVWYAGTFSGGGMANVGITQGAWTDTTTQTFTNTPFGAIDTIRIVAQNYLNSPPATWWQEFPQQIEIGYTTATFNPNNGFSFNSGTLGVLPGTYSNIATITAVNGAAPTSATNINSAYTGTVNGDGSITGWVNLTNAFTQGVTVLGGSAGNSGYQTEAYVDLTVAIPAGATSICVSFGQDNGDTGNPGGLAIAAIQATLHPTWSPANGSMVWDSATANWTSTAGTDLGPVTYSDGLGVLFNDAGGGGTVTIQGSGSSSQVSPYSVTFANNSTNYTLTGNPIAGSGPLTVTGSGTVTLANANTFTGTTSVTGAGGTLNLSNSNALQGSTLLLTGVGNIVFDQSVGSHAFTLGGITGRGNLTLEDNANPTNPVALSVGANNQSTAYAGVLSGSGSLTKTGTGSLTLSGVQTYNGPTIVKAGTLQLENAAIPVTSGLITELDASTLTPGPISSWTDLSGNGYNLALERDRRLPPLWPVP